jgi:hypothetical protein
MSGILDKVAGGRVSMLYVDVLKGRDFSRAAKAAI